MDHLCPCGATFGKGGDPNIVFSHLYNNIFDKIQKIVCLSYCPYIQWKISIHPSQRIITSISLTAFSILVKQRGITYVGVKVDNFKFICFIWVSSDTRLPFCPWSILTWPDGWNLTKPWLKAVFTPSRNLVSTGLSSSLKVNEVR